MSVHRYTIELDPHRHQILLTLALDDLPPGPLRLAVPTWVPGAYAFLRFGRDVLELRAEDAATGRPLIVTRAGWSGWTVEHTPAAVRVHARINAWEPAWGEVAGLVDDRWTVLSAARYPFAPDRPGPCEVEYRLPREWPLHHPSGPVPLGSARYRYPNQAALLDTPVVAGAMTRVTREVRGTPFHAVFLDRPPVGEPEEVPSFLDGLARVAETCHQVFGSFPFADYTFVFETSAESTWGLEHAGCTLVTLDPEVFIDPRKRAEALRVCAHELFHAWNGCRLKAAPLGTPDLVAGSFPDGLWVTEGFTRYYEFLLGVRGGWLRPTDLFANLVNYHRHLEMRPAWERVSPQDSSRATFLNHHRFPGAVNASLDYYDQGMLLAFDLEVELRSAGDSLDAAMRDLFAAWSGRGSGYSSDDIRAFFAARRPAAGQLVAEGAGRPAAVQTEHSLRRLGFEVERGEVGFLGLLLDGEGTGPRLRDVSDASPAAEAGLAPGDELLGIDGRPFRPGVLRYCIERSQRIALLVRRGERTWTVDVPVARRSELRRMRWAGTGAQSDAVGRWLGVADFRPEPGQAFPLGAHDNFHGIQTIL